MENITLPYPEEINFPLISIVGMKPGEDTHHALGLMLEDFYFGRFANVPFEREYICPGCDGHGMTRQICTNCNAAGITLQQLKQLPRHQLLELLHCGFCDCKGEIVRYCATCKGEKSQKERKMIRFYIEKGSKTNRSYCYPGLGNWKAGIKPGDVHFVLHEEPHINYTRHGDDLVTRVKVGESGKLDRFILTYIDGSMSPICMENYVRAGFTGIIRGKGMPRSDRPNEYGDIYVQFVNT